METKKLKEFERTFIIVLNSYRSYQHTRGFD